MKNKILLISMLSFAATTANAAAAGTPIPVPDLNPIVVMIYGIMALVSALGMAVLSVYSTAKVFKWVKAAF